MKNKKELLLSKDLPLDEVSVYAEVLRKEIIDSQVKEDALGDRFFVIMSEDRLIADEVVRDIIMEYKEPITVETKDDARLWF